jgi:hypothetical protein
MKTIAVNAELEHGLEQKISINIRALTFVATMYLPASLLAVCAVFISVSLLQRN